jgi:hypothetical protein
MSLRAAVRGLCYLAADTWGALWRFMCPLPTRSLEQHLTDLASGDGDVARTSAAPAPEARPSSAEPPTPAGAGHPNPAQIHADALFQTRAAIWATRDGCLTHYPHRCPGDCPQAGRHDGSLGELCECRGCEAQRPATPQEMHADALTRALLQDRNPK